MEMTWEEAAHALEVEAQSLYDQVNELLHERIMLIQENKRLKETLGR